MGYPNEMEKFTRNDSKLLLKKSIKKSFSQKNETECMGILYG